MRVIKSIFIFCIAIACTSDVLATHVAGGSMTYRCLGNSEYEISLEFRRDCFNGAPDAQFDRVASIGIFDANNQQVVTLGQGGQLLIPFVADDTLNERLTSVCNVIGDDVCVQTTVYKDTVILPPRPGGYILAYQRCCRNNALSNIADPLNTGATYWVRITERALQECNNSPVFENLPSVFICVNDTLRFDHRATDIDGDSLVYFLCTPSAGASEPDPMPQPPNNPPFEQVVWRQGFSENNMMGGSPISIDQNTGQILAVPNQVGQFLIGVCVREYRDGELLSEIRRDYEYAVRICGRDPIAGFVPETDQRCDGLEVQMENLTTSNFLPLDSIEFSWVFDFPEGTLTSTEVNPLAVYPEAGMYEIRMIATDGICFDTVFANVGVAPEGDPTADFAFDSYDCDGETFVQFYQTSITSQPDAEHIWNVRFGSQTVTLTGPEPVLNIGMDQSILVNYEIQTPSGCNDVVAREVEIQTVPLRAEFEDKIICQGEDVVIFSTQLPGVTVEISPDIGIQTDGSGNYFIEGFSGRAEFEIFITDGFCVQQGFVTITSDEEPDFPLENIIQCGQDTVALNTQGPDFYYYEWVGPQINDPQESNPQVSLDSNGQYFVTVSTSEGSLCNFSDSLEVRVADIPEFDILTDSIPVVCDGDQILLSLTDSFPTMIWTNESGETLGFEQELLIEDLQETTIFSAQVFTADGCTEQKSIEVNYSRLPVINVSGNTSTLVCPGEDAVLRVVSLDSISWLDTLDNLLATGFELRLENITEETEITVVASNEFGCETDLSFNVGLHPVPETDLTPLQDINICPGMIIPVNISSDNELSWFDENGDLVNTGTDWVIENIFADTPYSILIENEFGCTEIDSFVVNVDPEIVPEIDLMILDSINVCIETDFNVSLSSQDSINWFDLEGNLLAQGNDFNISNVTDTLNFQVEIIDDFNCKLRDTFQIEPFAGIELEVSSSSQEDFYCEGELIDLATMTNVNADIQWFLDGQLIAEGDSLLDYAAQGDVFFEAIAMDQFGCMSKDSFFLRESSTAGQIIGDDLICISGLAQLSYVPEESSDIFSISWTPQENIVVDDGLNISVQLDSTETYFVLYSNEDDCITEDTFQIDVSGFFEDIIAFASPDEIFLGQTTELSTDQPADFLFDWTPEETLDDPMSDMPIAMPSVTSTYIVTVTDEFGCTDTAEVSVNVIQPNCDESDVFVPNSFSPNGDNFNDVFRVESNFIDEQKLMIYNRWGEQVFYSEEPDAAWDGTYKGEILTADVYGFYLEVICINGFEYSTQGNITLFR